MGFPLTGGATAGPLTRPDLRWLVEAYRADRDVVVVTTSAGPVVVAVEPGTEGGELACRCYRCGVLVTAGTVMANWSGSNIRPACQACDATEGAR